ncbi:hypothetical protein KAFR_0A05920 [Kazachstania africana CBS 2517]|uniref:RING-type domain-containing protein n=1 Tax=Kazachstania africana (strain ATCC 22294 / BCRC 22015 / CBS 2517 / CECT 1963 / NBRC 1671 / NRRL Y-8276) TaxID=1071382 RepID=H2ANS7_KAZAF|nr:hypothetical protein KAFR_0A05920 [Kazachstania africana CBS 2517]CCF56027.1 hypothetical protein KAFR_0A05920 [Kazachstania africana CBS 2517]
MSLNQFSQEFVFCNVCHIRYSKEDPLNLTSCAHILCKQHISPDKKCPVCQTEDISIIKLLESKHQQLPTDVKLFFEPIPNLMENIYNVANFQVRGLLSQLQYYQNHCVKLREKVARQQQLLYKAKQELDAVASLKERNRQLESLLRGGNNFFSNITPNSVSSFKEPPHTVDLTLDVEEPQQLFVDKLKKTTSFRKNSNSHNIKNLTPTRQSEKNVTPMNSLIAESTHINKYFESSSRDSKAPILNSSSISPLGHSSLSYNQSTGSSKTVIGITKDLIKKPKFPNALERLRINKRNNTTQDETVRRTISNSTHVKSSNGDKTFNPRKRSTTSNTLSSYNNFKRIK